MTKIWFETVAWVMNTPPSKAHILFLFAFFSVQSVSMVSTTHLSLSNQQKLQDAIHYFCFIFHATVFSLVIWKHFFFGFQSVQDNFCAFFLAQDLWNMCNFRYNICSFITDLKSSTVCFWGRMLLKDSYFSWFQAIDEFCVRKIFGNPDRVVDYQHHDRTYTIQFKSAETE